MGPLRYRASMALTVLNLMVKIMVIRVVFQSVPLEISMVMVMLIY